MKVAGKTRTVELRAGARLDKFQREVDTYKEFRALSDKLIAVSYAICAARPEPGEASARLEEKILCALFQAEIAREVDRLIAIGAIETSEELGGRIFAEAILRGSRRADKTIVLGEGADVAQRAFDSPEVRVPEDGGLMPSGTSVRVRTRGIQPERPAADRSGGPRPSRCRVTSPG